MLFHQAMTTNLRALALALDTPDPDEPWLLLDLAWQLEPGWLRELLVALADAWEELPEGWQEEVRRWFGWG